MFRFYVASSSLCLQMVLRDTHLYKEKSHAVFFGCGTFLEHEAQSSHPQVDTVTSLPFPTSAHPIRASCITIGFPVKIK